MNGSIQLAASVLRPGDSKARSSTLSETMVCACVDMKRSSRLLAAEPVIVGDLQRVDLLRQNLK